MLDALPYSGVGQDRAGSDRICNCLSIDEPLLVNFPDPEIRRIDALEDELAEHRAPGGRMRTGCNGEHIKVDRALIGDLRTSVAALDDYGVARRSGLKPISVAA